MSPHLGCVTYFGDALETRRYIAYEISGTLHGKDMPRIAYLDLCLDDETLVPLSGGGVCSIRPSHTVFLVNGTRVFAREGGMRIFIRWKDGTWEERFVPDDELEKLIDETGHIRRPGEFWRQLIHS